MHDSTPNLLFQLGDQIYADDVSFTLFERVRLLANALFDGRLTDLENEVHILNDKARRKLLKPLAPAFSQDDGVCNQLLTFPEFCAYTLLHFNADLWGDLKELASFAILSNPGLRRSRVEEELRRLELAREHLRDYLIVLQRTVVYSLPDDHDVCDDFALDNSWDKQITAARGKSDRAASVADNAIFSAMATYALFQDVGSSSMGSKILQLLEKEESPVFTNMAALQWTYVPKVAFPAIALDTRFSRVLAGSGDMFEPSDTTRYVNSSGRFRRGDQIERADLAMDRVQNAPKTRMFRGEELNTALLNIDAKRLVLFTPSPVISARGFDEWKLKGDQFYEFDFEGWKTNISSYANLIHDLVGAGISEVCAFGGDIHFSYFKQSEIRLKQPNGYRPLLFSQITTSPFMNGYERKFGSPPLPFQEVALNLLARRDEGYSAYVPLYEGTRVACWEIHKSEDFKKWEPPEYIEEIVGNGGLFINSDKSNIVNCNFCVAIITSDGRLESFEIVSTD